MAHDLLDSDQLSSLERFQIQFIRKSLESGRLDDSLRWLQRAVGSTWIEHCIKNLRHVHGEERLPRFDPTKSYVCVANHRSFFDLYVVTGFLVRRRLIEHRILFPVRSNFFYDHPLGFLVNGIMSFFAMYPPVFRDRKRQALNIAGIDETARLLRAGGMFVGLHPEGTRNQGDPYELLPAQSGVGKIIHAGRAEVIPVFINGLSNRFVSQIASNTTRTGDDVNVVFGAPIDYADLFALPPSPRTNRRVAERALDAIRALGEEERQLRAKNPAKASS